MDEVEVKEKKEIRKRTKSIIKDIQNQLNFYFGHANLRHDRFLRKEIEDSNGGYLDVSLLLKFNKLKKICSDIELIKKALKFSEKFELNEDGKSFRLKEQLPELENPDKKTVYVEQLHGYCDHEWLMQVFSICGKVEYISLPRYKHNNKIKGFAFIEFSKEEEAERACRTLNTAAPRKKQKKTRQLSAEAKCQTEISTSEKQKTPNEPLNTEIQKRKRSISLSSDGKIKEGKNIRKRRRSSSISIDGSPLKTKHTKLIDISKKMSLSFPDVKTSSVTGKKGKDEVSQIVESVDKNDSSQKELNNIENISDCKRITEQEKNEPAITENEANKQIQNPVSSSDINAIEKENVELKETKTRKRKHRKKKDDKMKEISVPPLYVITKTEWATLKKQYKNLQRRELQELKKTYKILKSERVRRKELKDLLQDTKNKDTKPSIVSADKIKKTVNKEITSSVSSLPDKNEETKETSNKLKNKSLVILPGTVVSLKTISENLTKLNIKADLEKHGEVTYVDFINGNLKGYVRFPSKEIAEKILKDCSNSQFTLANLTKTEEEEYVKKAQEDREKKYNQNKKNKAKKKKRGSEKILERLDAEKQHLRFEEQGGDA